MVAAKHRGRRDRSALPGTPESRERAELLRRPLDERIALVFGEGDVAREGLPVELAGFGRLLRAAERGWDVARDLARLGAVEAVGDCGLWIDQAEPAGGGDGLEVRGPARVDGVRERLERLGVHQAAGVVRQALGVVGELVAITLGVAVGRGRDQVALLRRGGSFHAKPEGALHAIATAAAAIEGRPRKHAASERESPRRSRPHAQELAAVGRHCRLPRHPARCFAASGFSSILDRRPAVAKAHRKGARF